MTVRYGRRTRLRMLRMLCMAEISVSSKLRRKGSCHAPAKAQ